MPVSASLLRVDPRVTENGFMKKKFQWRDLHKLVDKSPEGSRERFAVMLMLAGQKIDLARIPRRQGFRKPSKVRTRLKKTLRDHVGVASEDNERFWFIPELYGETTA